MSTTIKQFKDLRAWQLAHQLTLDIYRITTDFPRSEIFNFISQMRRAALSIGANIAEGFCRYTSKDRVQFYIQARGSLSEIENFLYLNKDLKYLGQQAFNALLNQIFETQKVLNGLIRTTRNQK